MAERSLRGAAMSGGRWSAVEAVGVQLLSTATTLILARILVEGDFAIVAIVASVTGLLGLASGVGLSASVVQRDMVEPIELSTSFWASLGLGVVLFGVGATAATPIAELLGHPDAASFIAVGAGAVVFGLTAAVPRAVLYRSFRYRSVTAVTVFANVAFAALAIGLVIVTDLGVWALIIAQVVRPALLLVGFLWTSGWVPQWAFSWTAVRADLGFNAGYFGGTAGMYLVKNVDYWVVARTLPDGTLGVYYLAYVLPTIIRQRMTWAIDRSLLPVMSRLRDDRQRFGDAYLRVVRFVALLAVPAMVGLALLADAVVPIAFGGRWEGAAVPMALLALAGAADALWQASSTLFVADGVPGRALPIVLVRLTVLVVGLLIAVQAGGLREVAVAVLLASVVGAGVGALSAVRLLGIDMGAYASALRPAVIPVLVMSGVVALIGAIVAAPWAVLVLGTLIGGAAYVGSGLMLHREAFTTLIGELRTVFTTSADLPVSDGQ